MQGMAPRSLRKLQQGGPRPSRKVRKNPMRPSVYECLASCLTGCVLLSGCNHEQPRPAVYTYARPVAVAPVAPPSNLAALPAVPLEQKPLKQEVERPEPVVQQVKLPIGEDDTVKRRSFADITAK